MNNSDPNASPNEKMDVPTAKTLADMAQVVVNAAKVEVEAYALLAKAENPEAVKLMLGKNDVLKAQ